MLAPLETESVWACWVWVLPRAQRRVLGGRGFWPCLPVPVPWPVPWAGTGAVELAVVVVVALAGAGAVGMGRW